MKNTLGTNLTLTLFGESHGEMMGAVLDGIAPGIAIDHEAIAYRLTQRRPVGSISTARAEKDPYSIVSGVKNGFTTGAPLAILIPNENTISSDYDLLRNKARPGHADYAAQCKYHGFQDQAGGGHFSGRVSAPLVAGGTVVRCALEKKGITIAAHLLRCGGVCDRPFSFDPTVLKEEMAQASEKAFAVLDDAVGEQMKERILEAKFQGDSGGGELEIAITGMPGGVGEPWFDSVEGLLSHALFGIPGIKGVAFGAGFDFCDMRGSQANDPFRIAEDGSVITTSNHNSGINGGITNGMPLRICLAVRPTPTLALSQDTIDFEKMENITLAAKGRHDPAIVHRVRAVAEAVCALVLGDLLNGRFGCDWFTKEE